MSDQNPPSSTQASDLHEQMNAADDKAVNPRADAKALNGPVISRRQFMTGGVALAALSFIGVKLSLSPSATAPSRVTAGGPSPLLGFKSVAVQHAPDFDTVVVPAGYTAEAFFSWGDPVHEDATPWRADASNDWQQQLRQAGQNHDGMHFFAFENDPQRGLLAINHEYTNHSLHPEGISADNGIRPLEEIRKEQAAHGISVIEIRQKNDGQWQRVYPSPYNRRISALTHMSIAGPLAGHDWVKTVADPDGCSVIGTLNNCSSGFTPWGTYLICEENWHQYFANENIDDYEQRVSHKRYGITQGESAEYYGWNTVDARFNATPIPNQPHQGYVNEPNRFGWVVEVDPFNPDSTPVKRTAFGRIGREGVGMALSDNGQMAYYSGDDTRGEYIYKFVPRYRYSPLDDPRDNNWLDDGILYVARFDEEGRGVWLPLVHGENGLVKDNGFKSQAEVLVNARAAADELGATPMDRPEWATVHPHSRDVFITLTNNKNRGKDDPVNAANPREKNLHGHIIRLREDKADPAATRFEWELFLLAGENKDTKDAHGDPMPEHLVGNIQGDIFSSPDGLGIDAAGRIWIQTDYDDEKASMASMGCNQVLCADPESREVRRFMVGPRGCELTGITWSPDDRTLWVNVQHPGISYPASDGHTRPRSTTVMIRREDGGIIGT